MREIQGRETGDIIDDRIPYWYWFQWLPVILIIYYLFRG
jgi:hypothetical protein